MTRTEIERIIEYLKAQHIGKAPVWFSPDQIRKALTQLSVGVPKPLVRGGNMTRAEKTRQQALAKCNQALSAAKAFFTASKDADIDFHLSEAINHVNAAFDYLEAPNPQ